MANTFNEVFKGFEPRRKGQRRWSLPLGVRRARVIGTVELIYGYNPLPEPWQALIVTVDGVEYPCTRRDEGYAIAPLHQLNPRKA